MSSTSPVDLPALCPRCRATKIELRSTSPVPGVWSVYACSTCLYAWRSTEPAENTDPDKYPMPFRLKPEALPDLPVIPAIPPLRGK
jgi:rubredoxin